MTRSNPVAHGAGTTAGAMLRRITRELGDEAGPCAAYEAEAILREVLGCSREPLYLRADRKLSREETSRIDGILRRRLSSEPLPYILSRCCFYDREFFVDPRVLIPRPETEILVELVLKREPNGRIRVLDIGTGSGAVAASLAAHRSAWSLTASDISREALTVARLNCGTSVRLVRGELAGFVRGGERFDCVVCNPPYIPTREIGQLEPGVRLFEPRAALDGGPDGLEFIRRLARELPGIMRSEGRLYFEIGCGQSEAVCGILADAGWRRILTEPDLTGRVRVIGAVRPESIDRHG